MPCEVLRDLLQQYLVAVATYDEASTEASDPQLIEKLCVTVQGSLAALDDLLQGFFFASRYFLLVLQDTADKTSIDMHVAIPEQSLRD